MTEKKLFLLDAMALIYRSYYALARSPRITSKGKNTNAQFGFTSTLIDLINKEKPTHLAVVFDTHAPTARHTDFTDYKANRQAAPEDIIAAIPDIKRIVKGFNLPCKELDGYEADDLIGTLAWEAGDLGYTVYMVTPDKDYGQLVRDNVLMYRPPYMGNSVELLGPKEVCAKWNISRVSQVIDLLGLMGDTSDNIPGIPGVGEKTAAKLLAQYDTLENVLAHAHEIKGALGEKVRNGAESAVISKKLATIITNVPVAFHEEDFRVKDLDKEALQSVFAELEFRTLGQRILGGGFSIHEKAVATPEPQGPTAMDLFGNPVPVKTTSKAVVEVVPAREESDNTLPAAVYNIANTPHEYTVVDTPASLTQLIAYLKGYSSFAFDTETTSLDANLAELVGCSFCAEKGKGFYIPLPADRNAVTDILGQLKTLFDDEAITWIGQNIKYDLLVLKWYGFEIKGQLYDTMLAHYVVEPEGKRSMDVLSVKYLQYEPVSIETLIGKKGKGQSSMRDVPLEDIKEYAAEDADVTLQLKHILDPMVEKFKVRAVLEQIENPLIPVLLDMEHEGIKIDVDFLLGYSKELEREIRLAEEQVYRLAGVNFNLSSPKQLGEVLFDLMKLDSKAKKTKTGQYATSEDVLAKLQGKHEIIDSILAYRELTKLKSTYVDTLPLLINPRSGRVHTSFNQTIAVTGRLSSINPNLQNIPIRTDRGREIRRAFIPRDEGHTLISADYSQIELRIAAAISGDEGMIGAFRDNKDIHTATAAKVYGVSEQDVDRTMRRNAKAVNFGIIYGQSAFGLAENLGISRTEAKTIIDSYFQQYPGIKRYMSETISFAQAHGYVETVKGRKRWLRDISSANQTVRGYAERNAINMPIQGAAADMIKIAMISVHKALRDGGFRTRMILQVHDELVFDAPHDEVEKVEKVIRKCMEEAMSLPNDVPVRAEAGSGRNWLEAH